MNDEKKDGQETGIELKVETEAGEANAIDTEGLTAEEIEMATKNGLLPNDDDKGNVRATNNNNNDKDNDKDKNDDTVEGNNDNGNKSKDGGKQTGEAEKEPTIEEKVKIKEAAEADLTPEEETELLGKYNKNEKGLYWKAKKEVAKRQAAESRATQAEQEAQFLKAQLKAYETIKTKIENPDQTQKQNESGDTIDDEEVYTGVEVKEMLAKKVAAVKEPQQQAQTQQQVQDPNLQAQRSQMIANNLAAQEAEAKQIYEDYPEALGEATNIIKVVDVAMNKQNPIAAAEAEISLRAAFDGDRKKIIRAKELSVQFVRAVAAGGVDEYGRKATEIVYELGKLNPNNNNTANSGQSKIGAEGVNKVIAHSRQVKPAASVGGGGKRFVSYQDLTPEMVAKMSLEEWGALPQEVRDKFMKM
jgi:hypothetical protein